MITSALIVKQPYIDLILIGEKTWEMRAQPCKKRGVIGLIEQGTGLIVGQVEIIDSPGPVTAASAKYFAHKHRIEDLTLLQKWRYPWVLSNAKRYEKPIPYTHPLGAQKWVKVNLKDGE